MAHYSIFIPGGSGASHDLLRCVGLDALQERQAWDWCDVARGPDDQSGVIGTVFTGRDGADPLRGYQPDKQKWTPGCANPHLGMPKGAYWFGFEPDRSPRPIDLAHRTIIAGYDVLLKDGNLWRIPETLQMPLDVGRDPDSGELTKFYSSHYKDFCKQAEKYAFAMFENIMTLDILSKANPNVKDEQIHVAFTLEDTWEYCATALNLNYRVCDPLVGKGYLDLLDERKMVLIVRATLAIPDILEVIEKKKDNIPFLFHPRWTEHVTWKQRAARPATWFDVYFLEREGIPWEKMT